MCCLYTYCYHPSALVLDTAVQIKTGLLMLDGVVIDEDIYSWHNGLKWILHEKSWYLLVGIIYKYFKVPGLVVLSMISNSLILIFISLINKIKYNFNSVYISLALLFNHFLFPSVINDIRPQLISIPITVSLAVCSTFIKNKKHLFLIFYINVLLVSLLHCSTVLLLYIIIIFRIFIDLIESKNIKLFIKELFIVILSLFIPILITGGIDSVLYLNGQSCYPEIMDLFSAWKPGVFTVIQVVYLLLLLIVLSINVMKNNKLSYTNALKLGYLCMFIIGYCIYGRIAIYLYLYVLFISPYFISFIIDYFKLDKINIIISKVWKKLDIIFVSISFVLYILVNFSLYDFSYIKTINDAAVAIGYDTDLISFIKNKGYNKIYNDFNIGTWLLFNDIKVHIDNRVDPYLFSYSGEDHFHNEYLISDLTHLDDFVQRYHPDALIFVYNKGDSLITNNGKEIYKHYDDMHNFINEINNYASDKYNQVYYNEITGKKFLSYNVDEIQEDNSINLCWVVYEPIYD